MNVQFFYSDRNPMIMQRTHLRRFITGIFKRERKNLSHLNYIFCSDQYLVNINKQFLQHDYYTDIITFDMSQKNNAIEGEIYISVDRVRDNAKNLFQPIKYELHRVIFHGALHLCGYTDKSERQIKEMRKKEDEYLSLYFK